MLVSEIHALSARYDALTRGDDSQYAEPKATASTA